jgi:glycosyltransferase involved in cell wall biosynthesis
MKSDIVFVGRLIREKHVDVLIDAVSIILKTFPALQCLIIGGGPERWNLEMKAKEKGISDHITFTGFLREYRDVIALMKSSRVFVLPSTREGFGMAALEGLSCGLPLVTIDHPKNAARVFVKERCGALSALDAADLADKITEMMVRGREETEGCHRMVRGYDWERITDLIEEYYTTVEPFKGQ